VDAADGYGGRVRRRHSQGRCRKDRRRGGDARRDRVPSSIAAAIASTFVTRAQREQRSKEQAEETVAEAPVDPQLEQMAARLEHVESLLLDLTKR
jgi:hypothetical protein